MRKITIPFATFIDSNSAYCCICQVFQWLAQLRMQLNPRLMVRSSKLVLVNSVHKRYPEFVTLQYPKLVFLCHEHRLIFLFHTALSTNLNGLSRLGKKDKRMESNSTTGLSAASYSWIRLIIAFITCNSNLETLLEGSMYLKSCSRNFEVFQSVTERILYT